MAQTLTPKVLIEMLAARGERPAVLSVRGEALDVRSAAEIADLSARLATGLLEAGFEAGEPVVIYAANRPEWLVARFAIGAAGALPVALDDLLPESDVEPFIRDSGSRRIFTSRAHLPALREICADLDLEYIILDPGEDAESEALSWTRFLAERAGPLPDLDPDGPAMVVYTSGTTGKPKSFALSHANLSANVRAIEAEQLVGPEDRALLPLPLDNVYPLVVGLLTPMVCGARICFPEAISGPQIAKALRVTEATLLIGVPRLYAALVAGLEGRVAAKGRLVRSLFRRLLALSIWINRRFGLRIGRVLFRGLHAQLGPKLRSLVSGGARLEPDLVWTLEGLGWEMLSGYGLAEVGSVNTANFRRHKRIGSEGKPIHGDHCLRIADPDADGVGEIQLRAPSAFSGYRDNPEANRMAFTEDGWFRTGDLGRVDADGYVYITGRAKEMIVLGGGKNVFPEEVEKVLSDSPYLDEVALLEMQGSLVALVVPNLEAIEASGSTRIEDVVRVTLASQSQSLPSFQRPSGLAISREPLPRTRLGKYRRFLLPELFERARRGEAPAKPQEESPEDRALLAASPAREVWQLLKARYPDKPLALDANPQLDLGIDSLEWLGITLELDDRFGIRLSEEEVAAVTDLRGFLQLVGRAAEAPQAADAGPAQAVSAADVERWLSPPSAAESLLGATIHAINAVLMRLLFGLRVDGAEHVPDRPPCLFIVNHVSDLDPIVVGGAMPVRQRGHLYWGGDVVRLFTNRLKFLLARALHVFPVDERSPAASLGMAAEVLARGESLVWFPESWRSPDGELQDFLPGVGRLICRFEGPVVPVLVSGTFEAMPRSHRLPRLHPVTVRFGPVLDSRALRGADEHEGAYRDIAAALREKVAALKR